MIPCLQLHCMCRSQNYHIFLWHSKKLQHSLSWKWWNALEKWTGRDWQKHLQIHGELPLQVNGYDAYTGRNSWSIIKWAPFPSATALTFGSSTFFNFFFACTLQASDKRLLFVCCSETQITSYARQVATERFWSLLGVRSLRDISRKQIICIRRAREKWIALERHRNDFSQ